MNENQIKSFLAIVQEGSMNKASEMRYISQPALKKQIDSLEAELDVKLIIRSAHGCILTPAGEYFYEQMSEVNNQIKDIKQKTKSFQNPQNNTVNIGVLPGLATPRLDEVCQAVINEYPSLQINFVPVIYKERITALREGKIDIAFYHAAKTLFKQPELRVWEYTTNKNSDTDQKGSILCECLLSRNNPLAKKEILEIADLQDVLVACPDYTVFGGIINQAKKLGIDLNVMLLDPDRYSIIEHCNNGGVYLSKTLRHEFKTLACVLLNYSLPPHCILTRINPSHETMQFVEIALREYLKYAL